MKTRNKLLTLLLLSTGAAASIAAINKAIRFFALKNPTLAKPDSLSFQWRLGNISYTKCGAGKPLLLIHDTQSVSGKHEWQSMVELLKSDYTVYSVDLLGCGCSEKPNITYTNYLYVQLISDFIKSEIGHRTSVLAVGESCAIPLMACANNPELFDRLLLLNPLSLVDYSMIPGKFAKTYKFLIDAPLLGTLIYNIAVSRRNLCKNLKTLISRDSFSGKQALLDAWHEASHLGAYPKALYVSRCCNYTKCNVVRALAKTDNSICLIGGSEIPQIQARLEEYKTYNPAVEIAYVPDTKELPHLERPGKLAEIINTYL